MKTGVLIGIIVVVLVVVIAGFYVFNGKSNSNSPSNVESGNVVKISGFAFSPSEIKIKSGESVTWINEDNAPHAIVSNSGNELASDSFSKGKSYIHTFNSAGTYEYHCSIHPSMKGKVIVE